MPPAPSALDELARDPATAQCLDWFRRSRSWINQQHLELCRIPAPTFLEQKRAEWMLERFTELGWDARLDGGGNVVATRPNCRRNAPAVALTAHMDTVLAPRSPADIRVGDEGRFLGPGVSDNGVGLTALLAIAAAWNEAPPIGDTPLAPMLIANVGEEGEGNLSGMRHLCQPALDAAAADPASRGKLAADLLPIKAFLILDGPSTEHITCQALASRRYEVKISGPGGHSWNDRGTPNPVHAISRVVVEFANRISKAARKSSVALASADSSYNFGIVQGGTSINAIPSEAWTKVDLRSEQPETIQRMAEILTRCVDQAVATENSNVPEPASASKGRAGKRQQLTAQVKEIGARPGGSLSQDAPMLEIIRAVDAHLGIRSRLDCSSTDANIPLSLGIPAISIGAGGTGGGAHTTTEWFHPHNRELGLQRVLLTLCLLLQQN